MPDIRVLYWNVEDFGHPRAGRRGDYEPLCKLIAQVMKHADADVLCLLELVRPAIANDYLTTLQVALHNAAAVAGRPTCHWYYDWLPGALGAGAAPPYDDFARDLAFTPQARHEGYAVFWRQNLAKLTMQRADPIDAAATGFIGPLPGNRLVVNRQSFGVCAPGGGGRAANGNPLARDIVVPAAPGGAAGWAPYTLPVGTTLPAGTAVFGAGGALIPAGAPTSAVEELAAGAVLPQGTVIGAAGLTLDDQVHGLAPILVPGGHTLEYDLTLPAAGAAVVPQHVLSLVLMGRPQPYGQLVGRFRNFDPDQPHFELMQFPGADGLWRDVATRHNPNPRACVPELTRRPAYCTVEVNGPAAKADRLIPITMYHAPYAAAPRDGMGRAAMGRSLYQAFDHEQGTFINNTRAILGGDFNQRLDPDAAHYRAYTDPFGPRGEEDGGAGCHQAAAAGGAPSIRVDRPAPNPVPAFPDIGGQVPAPRHNPLNKTMVQLIDHHGGGGRPVLSADSYHYRRNAFDNVFYRGFTVAQSPRSHFVFPWPNGNPANKGHCDAVVYDLLKALLRQRPIDAWGPRRHQSNPTDNFFIDPAVIRAFQFLPIFMPPTIPPGVRPPAHIPRVLSPAALLRSIQAGAFSGRGPRVADPAGFAGPHPLPRRETAERRAAEFLRLFVSDHLPVIFRMTLEMP